MAAPAHDTPQPPPSNLPQPIGTPGNTPANPPATPSGAPQGNPSQMALGEAAPGSSTPFTLGQITADSNFHVVTADGLKLTAQQAGQVPIDNRAIAITGNSGAVITLPNGNKFSIPPNSRVALDQFVFNPNPPAPQTTPVKLAAPPNGNGGDCTGAPAGTAVFGIAANPDHPALDCSSASMQPAPPTSSVPPEPPPPRATYCDDLSRQIDQMKDVAARASLAQDIYNFYDAKQPSGWKAPPGFTFLSHDITEVQTFLPGMDTRLIKDLFDPDDLTYRAAIYKDPTGNIFLVFRGSVVDGTDWYANRLNELGLKTPYVDKAQMLANALKRYADKNGVRVEIVGHSLGGALAIASALAAHVKATVFNAETVHNSALDLGSNVSNADDLVVDYITPNEPVTTLQGSWVSAPGRHVMLPDWPGSPPASSLCTGIDLSENLFSEKGVKGPLRQCINAIIERHVISSVRLAIQNQIELLRKSSADNACNQFKQQFVSDPKQE